MRELTELERQLTERLLKRGAAASPSTQAWQRLSTSLTETPGDPGPRSNEIEWIDQPVQPLRTLRSSRPASRVAVLAVLAAVVGAGLVAGLRRGDGSADISSWDRLEHGGLIWSRVPDNAPDVSVLNSTTTSPPVPGLAGAPHMDAVAVGGPGLVVVGTDLHVSYGTEPRIWTSADGRQWRRSDLDPLVFGDSPGDQLELKSVAAGGPGVVVVGSGGESGHGPVWTSPDGFVWSIAEGEFSSDDSPKLTSVVAGGPGLVAVGQVIGGDGVDAAVWTSVDGLWWSRVPHDPMVFGGPGRQTMTSVTTGGPGLVAVGYEDRGDDAEVAVIWTSTDGRSWSRVPHDETVFGGPNGLRANSVTAGGPGVLAVGFEHGQNLSEPITGVVWTSPDGVAWQRLPSDAEAVFTEAILGGVIPYGSGLIVVGGTRSDLKGGVWASPDGLRWCRVPHNEAVFGNTGVAAGVTLDSDFVAVGAGFGAEWGSAVWIATPTEDGFSPCVDEAPPSD